MLVVVGTCTLVLYIPQANSLKDKRSVVKSMLEGMHRRFNVSAAEVADNDTWRRAVIGIACVSNSATHTDQVLNSVLNWVDENPRIQITDVEMETL